MREGIGYANPWEKLSCIGWLHYEIRMWTTVEIWFRLRPLLIFDETLTKVCTSCPALNSWFSMKNSKLWITKKLESNFPWNFKTNKKIVFLPFMLLICSQFQSKYPVTGFLYLGRLGSRASTEKNSWPIMSNFWGQVFHVSGVKDFFWKHCSVHTKKMHNTFSVNLFVSSIFLLQNRLIDTQIFKFECMYYIRDS